MHTYDIGSRSRELDGEPTFKISIFEVQDLAIPGTHDSGTYAITPDSDISPDFDSERWISMMPYFMQRVLKREIYRWSYTQSESIYEQLKKGIRYLDLRVAVKAELRSPVNKSDRFYIVHSLFANKLEYELQQIRSFLKIHPKEIVILDFQKLWHFSTDDMTAFEASINNTFGISIIPCNSNRIRLRDLWAFGEQVFVILKSQSAVCDGNFWSRTWIRSDWANTNDPVQLKSFLQENQRGVVPYSRNFFVHQAVLTPSWWDILHTTMATLTSGANRVRDEFVREQQMVGGTNRMRIVISDFATHNDFPRNVIESN